MSRKFEIIVCDDQEFDPAIVEMYQQHNYNLKEPEWIDWKYRKNPYGEPFLVIARSNGIVAGMQAHLPRHYFSGNRLVQAVEAVDAFVRPSFRRDGIYQHIWTEARRIIKDRNLVLTTFPSARSQSIGAMRKEGLKALGSLNTYIKMLRPAAILKGKNLRTLSSFYKNLFEPFSRVNRTPRGLKVDVGEITRFQCSIEPKNRAVVGGRSQDYLNWKFCDGPMNDYTCILFSESGEDIGFAALRFDTDKFTLTVHDCVIYRDFSGCIEAFKRYVWDNHPDVGVIFVTELESGPLAPALRKAGFFSTSSNQLLMLDNIDELKLPLDPGQWLITRGDSDW
jgi:hypothetical protein